MSRLPRVSKSDTHTLIKLEVLPPIEYVEDKGSWRAYIDVLGYKRLTGEGSKQHMARADVLKKLRRWLNDNLFR